MSKTVTWQLRKLLVAILLCVTFFAFATACGGSVTGNEDPGQENASVLIVGGAPGAELGKEGDICFDSASRTLYVKDAQRWVETEYLSCEVEENSLNVTFKDGTVKRYALSDGAETSCEHEFGEEVYTVHPATCVTPGIGVHVCTKCYNTFAVVIPADGVTHDIQPDGKCSICGEKVAFTADPDPDDPTGSVVVQGVEDSRQTKIVIPEKIEGKDVKVAAEAFKGNTTIEEVEIQGSVSVGDSAFEGCTNLESLTIQEGTKSIGDNAFKDCENLENVTIPESVTSVGADAFDGTKYYTTEENWKIEEDHKVLYDASEGVLLKAKDYTAPVPAGRRNAARSGGGEYRLQADVRVIADGAFVGVENLTRVVLNEGLKTVGKGAFEGTKLEGVILPAGIENVEGLKGLHVNFYFRGVEGEWTYGSDLGENYYYLSEVPPTKEGNYWFEKDGAPVVWELTALELNYSECTTEYCLNEEFSSEGLKVTAVFNGETRGAAETFTVDSKAVNLLKAGSYDVTVTYLGVSATYSVTVKPFTVTIVYGNGTDPTTATVNEGGENNYTLPAAPARTGYTFNGWKVGEGGTSDAETKITVSADVTIEAQWHVVGVNVEFSLGEDGEKGSATAKSDFKEDKYEITIQGTPTRSGYRFNGWHYEVNGTSGDLGVEGGTFTVDLADEMTITVTAQWVQQVTVTYQYNNTQGKVEKTVDVGTDVELPTPEHKTGYDFEAWYVGGQKLEGKTYKADSDVTLEAHWTARTPVVTVAYGDENAKGNVTASYELNEAEAKYTITLNGEDPTLDGSKFIGWTVSGAVSLELDATAKTFTIDLADEMNVTVTAKWAKLYTVTVTAQRATLSEELNGNQYTEGESFSFSVTVDKGYKLVSVKNGESDLTAQDGTYTVTVGTDDITITVTTAEVEVKTSVVDAEGVTLNVARSQDGTQATITVNGTPTKAGYTFDKWTVTVGGDSKDYAESLTIELGNDDVSVVYTAHWTPKEPVITVQGEGTTGVTTSFEFNEQEKTYTVTIKGTPTYEKHRFDGWTVAGGTPAELTAEQTTFTVALSDDMNVTLTAKWVEQVTVTYALGEHAAAGAAAPAAVTVDKDGTVTLPEAPNAAEGYEFAGWFVSGEEVAREEKTELTVTADVTVTAQWTAIYTLTVIGAENADVSYVGQQDVYHTGDIVMVTIEAHDGFKVKQIAVSGDDEAQRATGDTECMVTFANSNITITVTIVNVYKVEVQGDHIENPLFEPEGPYEANTSVKVLIEASEGYEIVSVMNADVELHAGGDGFYTVEVVDKDVTITVTTKGKETSKYSVTVNGDHIDTIGYEPEGNSYDAETSVTITITPTDGYKITSIEADVSDETYEEIIEEDGSYAMISFTITSNVTITVTTEEIKYTVSLKAETEHVEIGDFKVGDVTNNGPYENGTTVSFTLTVTDSLYVITSVKNDTQDLTAQGGRYSVMINGANVEITVTTDYNYGTEENPLTIEQAIALGTAQCGTKEETWTKQMVYVRGVVAEAPTISGSQYKQFYLGNSKADDTTKLLVWATELAAEVDAPEKNDTVIIHGYIEYYQSKLELTGHSGSGKDYPTIVSNERGLSGIEVTNNDGATVKTSDGGDLPGSAENGTEITFKVTVSEEGKKAVVTVNGVTVNPDGEGNYKFTVHGDMTVDIKVVDASAATETTVILNIGEYATKNKWSDGSQYARSEETAIVLDENIKAYMSASGQNGYYSSSSKQWRLYSGSVTFVASNGAMIQSITVTYNSSSSGQLVDGSNTLSSPAKFENINKDSITINKTSSGQVRITDISVTYTGGTVPSDEDKVQAAAEAYELPAENKTYSEVKIYDLPTETTGGVTITWALTGTSDYCSIDGGTKLNVTSLPEQDENVELTATFHLNGKTATNTYTVTIKAKSSGGETQTVYKKVTSVDELQEGKKIVFVYGTTKIAGGLNKDYLVSEDVTVANNEIKSTGNGVIWTLQKDGNNWKFLNEKGQALGATAAKKVAIGSGTVTWTISVASDGTATVKNTNTAYGTLYYNTGSPRFTTYTSTQGAIQIYIESTGA